MDNFRLYRQILRQSLVCFLVREALRDGQGDPGARGRSGVPREGQGVVSCLFPGQGVSQGGPGGSRGQGEARRALKGL